jgi:hypothetical protein
MSGECSRYSTEADIMRMPPTEAIDTAIAWLESNEGDNGEAERCKLIAKWLEHMNTEAFIRHEARARGVTPARLRRLLKEHGLK